MMRRRIYPQDVAQLENLSFTVRSKTGSPFTGMTSDHYAYSFAVHGYFNWRNVVIARAVCGEGDTILEVGANTGTESVSYSDVVGESGAVYAFEPLPSNLELLRANAAQTRHRNITVFPLALSDREGVVRFAAPEQGNSGLGYVLGSADSGALAEDGNGVVEIRCATLDSVLPGHRPPRLIMIDAEGHEGAILDGADQLLARYRPVIVLEVIKDYLVRAGSDPAQIGRHLNSLDYDLFEIQRFGLTPIEAKDGPYPPKSDWLAVPASDAGLAGRIQRTIRRAGLMPCTASLNPLCSK